jgi:hypothetical protein
VTDHPEDPIVRAQVFLGADARALKFAFSALVDTLVQTAGEDVIIDWTTFEMGSTRHLNEATGQVLTRLVAAVRGLDL